MAKEFIWAIDEDGKPCKCYAKPENRGKGKCPHKLHQIKGETVQEMLSRSKRKLNVMGVSGSVRWSIDSDGLMLFTPIEGDKGKLDEPVEISSRPRKLYWQIWRDKAPLIKKIKALGKISLPNNCSSLFWEYSSLTDLDLSNFDASNVVTMKGMFRDCPLLTNLDLSNFNTSNATDMSNMFRGCSSLTDLDLSSFDTDKVKTMKNMFYGCANLKSLDLSNFDTRNVKDMDGMFSGCSSLEHVNLSSFDTANVTDMESMFYRCKSLAELDISNFNINKVRHMGHMFYDCTNLKSLDLSNFDSIEKADTRYMFLYADSLSDLKLSRKNEERTDCISLLITLGRYNNGFCSSVDREKTKALLGLLEKTTGSNYSKAKGYLKTVSREDIDKDGISDWKADKYPCKEAKGLLAILESKNVTNEDLQTKDFKALKEKGVLSDIDSFVKGVPLEDILA